MSLPPPKVKKTAKAWVLPPPPPKAKKNPAKKKEKPPPPKLAYEMTNKELHAHVRKEVTDHFVPRKPEPKQPVDLVGQKFFVTMANQGRKEHYWTMTVQSQSLIRRRVIVTTTKSLSSKNNPNNQYLH
jgi:hypothetical protein